MSEETRRMIGELREMMSGATDGGPLVLFAVPVLELYGHLCVCDDYWSVDGANEISKLQDQAFEIFKTREETFQIDTGEMYHSWHALGREAHQRTCGHGMISV
jgi:hypothetical protein